VHLVAQRLTDLSPALASVGNRDGEFPLPHGRGDEFHRGAPGLDPRERQVKRPATRDIYVADLHTDAIRVKTRDFH
jgi:error-prone DNA polymerase